MKEIWCDVPGYEGLYKVSNMGRVKSCLREIEARRKDRKNVVRMTFQEKILKICEAVCFKTGAVRYRVSLYKNKVQYSKEVSCLVAEAFLGPRPKDGYIKHINGDIRDNRADNLHYRIYQRKAA